MFAVTAVVLLLLVFVPLPSLTLKGKGAVRTGAAPVERGASSLLRRLSEAAAAIRGIGGVAEENLQLRRDISELKSELSGLRDAEFENARLRQAFRFYKNQPDTMIACDVISRNISGWWSSVRVGKGSHAGIAPNLAVISPDGLVGKTTEVAPFSTEVLLISDPACQVSARIRRDDVDVFGRVRGMGTNMKGQPRARIEFVNKDAVIRNGDEVVTSGLGAFPKGVHIGYVEKIYRDESGLYQYADIIPRATVGLLDFVFVILPSNREVVQ